LELQTNTNYIIIDMSADISIFCKKTVFLRVWTDKKENDRMATGKSKKSKKRKKKNTSDGTMKFLLVLVIAGLAIAMILFMQKGEEAGSEPSGTPEPTITLGAVPSGTTLSPQYTGTPVPVMTQTPEATKAPTKAPTKTPEATKTPTPVPTEEPEPTPQVDVLSVEDAQKLVKASVAAEYSVHLLNDHLWVGEKEYYQFYILDGQAQILYPFLVVDKLDGSLFCYDGTENTLLDFSRFPLGTGAQGGDTDPDVTKTISAKEAYEILCTYSKESLHIAKEVVSYDAEYGNELTLVNGTINCYRINLSEISDNGRVSNKGEFYISVDGTKCYYNDSETNEFVLVQK